jgi:hypothetical protein
MIVTTADELDSRFATGALVADEGDLETSLAEAERPLQEPALVQTPKARRELVFGAGRLRYDLDRV